MSFKFNFFDTNKQGNDVTSPADNNSNNNPSTRQQLLPLIPCVDWTNTIHQQQHQQQPVTTMSTKTWQFGHNSSHTLLLILPPNQQAESLDVTPGIYEGGFKTWECAVDLATFLADKIKPRIITPPKRVLDLGCGTGLCGLAAMKLWPEVDITFQDLNADVLISTTYVNMMMNFGADRQQQHGIRRRFVSGSWQQHDAMVNLLTGEGNERFDLILTADTLYDQSNYLAMLAVARSVMNPGGAMYVSAKRVYFGCDGGVIDFMRTIHALPNHHAEVVASVQDGESNVRDVIQVTIDVQ